MNYARTPFRHRPKRRIAMRQRPACVPRYWRVVDFRGPEYMGRQLPALGTRQMELLRLVLDSRSIPYMVTGHGSQARAFVPPMFETLSRRELADVALEKTPVSLAPSPRHNAHLAMLVMLFLLFWHGLIMGWWAVPFAHMPEPDYWKMCGRLDAAAVKSGEWWRMATALTLHADSLHLFSNIIFGAPFLILLARRLGLGITLALTLIAGMLGNAMNVLYREPGYTSLGYSTAMFATVGLLCADATIRSHSKGLRLILPAAAGMAFLALLGTEGQNTDYAAHVFGLFSGFLLGLAASIGLKLSGSPPRRLEYLAGFAAPVFLILCWYLAL